MHAKKYEPLDFSKKKEFTFEEVPGLQEAGWTKNEYREAKEGEEKTFEQSAKDILKRLENHDNSWPFKEAVDVTKVPDYPSVVKKPMDLKIVRRKFEQKQYQTRDEFKEDILLIFSNSKLYNAKETIYYKYAEQLEREVTPSLNRLKLTMEELQILQQ